MKKRSWTEKQLRTAVLKSYSFRQVINNLGLRPAGGNYDQIKKYIQEFGIKTVHFKGHAWNKGLTGTGKPKIDLKDILVENSNFQSFKLKIRLFSANLKPRQCEECGWKKETTAGYLPLELHHVNGNRHDNRLENLKILCPNCHSLTPFHRGRGQRKW